MATPLRDLMDRIRAEARIKGPDTLVGLIITIFNATAREYTARRRFPQLYVAQHEIVAVGAGQNLFNLPANLQVLQKDNIYYSEDGNVDTAYGLLLTTSNYIGSIEGQPNRIQRVGNTLQVFPYSDVAATSSIFINYWRFPTALAGYADIFEIDELEETIVKETIARVSRLSDSDVSAQFITEANRSYSASFGVNPQG